MVVESAFNVSWASDFFKGKKLNFFFFVSRCCLMVKTNITDIQERKKKKDGACRT